MTKRSMVWPGATVAGASNVSVGAVPPVWQPLPVQPILARPGMPVLFASAFGHGSDASLLEFADHVAIQEAPKVKF